MKSAVLKAFCVLAALPLVAATSLAQQTALIPDEVMSQAKDDISRMGETELGSLDNVLNECSFPRIAANTNLLSGCLSSQKKYQTEYNNERTIDRILFVLQTTTLVAANAGKPMTFSFRNSPGSAKNQAVDDMRHVMQMVATPGSEFGQKIADVETNLKEAVSESLRKRRAK